MRAIAITSTRRAAPRHASLATHATPRQPSCAGGTLLECVCPQSVQLSHGLMVLRGGAGAGGSHSPWALWPTPTLPLHPLPPVSSCGTPLAERPCPGIGKVEVCGPEDDKSTCLRYYTEGGGPLRQGQGGVVPCSVSSPRGRRCPSSSTSASSHTM